MAGELGTNRSSGCLLVFDDILKNVIKLLGGWGSGCGAMGWVVGGVLVRS